MKFKEIKKLIFQLFLFVITILAVSFLWGDNPILLIVLVLESILVLILWHKKYDLIYFVVGAIFGPLAEITAIYSGAWEFTNPNFF
jgi:hypothetical protein